MAFERCPICGADQTDKPGFVGPGGQVVCEGCQVTGGQTYRISAAMDREKEAKLIEGALLDFLNNGVEYITRKRFCDVLGITEKSFKEGQSRGRFNFPEHRLGRHIFVKRSEILESLGGDAK